MGKATAKKNILVAEDEKAMAMALKLKLEGSGFTVAVANDGEEALQKIQKEKFDLMLLDLIMPQKDGFAVLEELKAQKNTMPVIVSSNLSQVEDVDRAKKLGAIDFFTKSDTPIVEVVARVRHALHV